MTLDNYIFAKFKKYSKIRYWENRINIYEIFMWELQLAKKCWAKLIILIEDEKVTCINDLYTWYNWWLKKSPKATKGSTLAKMLTTIQNNTDDYNCEFLFVKKSECGAKIIELLKEEKNENI